MGIKQHLSRFILLVLILFPHDLKATTAEFMGVGARAIGLGGAFTSLADNPSALYYNPAGLTSMEGNYIGIGYLYGTPNLSSNDKEIEMYDERMMLIHAGWMFGGPNQDMVGTGLSIFMPQGSIYKLRMRESHEPYFLMYENNVQTFQLRLGGAFKPAGWVSIGGSVMLLASLDGYLDLYTPFVSGDVEEGKVTPDKRMIMTMDQDLPNLNYYSAGIIVYPLDGWSIGLSYRGESYVMIDLGLEFVTDTFEDINEDAIMHLPVEGDAIIKTKYTPPRLSIGTSYKHGRLLACIDLDWIWYSKYEVPNAMLDIDEEKLEEESSFGGLPVGSLLKSVGLYPPLLPDIKWRDVYAPRTGIEYWVTDWFRMRSGYTYEYTPIKSTDLPNFDCDKHFFSLGLGFRFIDFLNRSIPGATNIDIAVQSILFEERDIKVSGDKTYKTNGTVNSAIAEFSVTF